MNLYLIESTILGRARRVSKVLEKAGVCSHYESAALPTELRRPEKNLSKYIKGLQTGRGAHPTIVPCMCANF